MFRVFFLLQLINSNLKLLYFLPKLCNYNENLLPLFNYNKEFVNKDLALEATLKENCACGYNCIVK